MRHYEVAVVSHPDLEMDLERASTKIETAITSLGGKINKKDNWGKRKLAYPINKQAWGIYTFYQISIAPSEVQALDNSLRINDEVMRYLIISMADVQRIRPPKTYVKRAAQKSTAKTKSATLDKESIDETDKSANNEE